MLRGATRGPLLPATTRPQLQRRGPPQRRARPRARVDLGLLLFLLLMLLLGGVTTVLYRRMAARKQAEAGAQEERRDGQRELHLLHQDPSPEFCALQTEPLVCAHGGDTAAAPPNTLRAFQAALDAGVRCLEVDAARTRDGTLVVLHARELQALLALLPEGQRPQRVQGVQHPQVGDLTWRELSTLLWRGGERAERVEDVVRLLLPQAVHITLDVKTYSQAGEEVDEDVMAQQIVDLVQRTRCHQCLVWAKSDAVVLGVKERAPQQAVGYVVMNETAAARAAGMGQLLRLPRAEVVALHYAMASPEVVGRARAGGKRVHAWTCNTAGMMRAALDAGVDAVVTNHPQQLQEAVGARRQRCSERRSLQQAQQGL